jgi:hypothetical protein
MFVDGWDRLIGLSALMVTCVLPVAAIAQEAAQVDAGEGPIAAPGLGGSADDTATDSEAAVLPDGAAEPSIDPEPVPRGYAGADAPTRAPRGENWDIRGQARLRQNAVSDFGTDIAGTTHGRVTFTETRLVLGAAWDPTRRLHLEAEVDTLNGQAAGDFTTLGQSVDDDLFRIDRYSSDDLRRVYPRKLFVHYDTNIARIAVGAQTFSWGTGMLANDGLSDQDFGDAWRGSLVARVALLSQPLRDTAGASAAGRGWTVVLAGDRVIEDDNASWYDGDDAYSAIMGTRIDTPRWSIGAFDAIRFQTDRPDPLYPEDRRTQVQVNSVDLYGRWVVVQPDPSHRLTLETELAGIFGTTDRPYIDETFEDGAAVRSFGGILRARYDSDVSDFTAKLELGYASGDNDPRDDVARNFSFNSDYNVGLILFDQVMPMLSARAADRVLDPELLAVPPSGVRYTVQQGVVTNAGYVNPVFRWRPVNGLDARFGYLYAVAAADVVDVYQTALAGGYNTNAGGITGASRALGHELDFALRYTLHADDSTSFRLGGEGGVFLPGAAFNGVSALSGGLRTLTMWRGTFDVVW